MDISQINWLYVAGGMSAVLFVAWLVALFRGRTGFIGAVVGFAHLIAACINTAAPIRGGLDPSYEGYRFGLLVAEPGLTVTTMAGAVFVTAVVGAFSALRGSREATLITAVTSVLFLVVLGWPVARDLMDGVGTSIQLGESMTIPGYVATGLLILFMLFPFAVGVLWSLMRARQAPSAAT
ncbi:hypothetical protein GVN21_10550 [Caulobacter sp. SLTY]|uniref:hypothetical protein n=1 Tax=Caulobacter sp. SLTY TaxID=2683262 RepID=UPI001412E48E|nr:hypothetical protein [Caulobacter sp. SLTY]NBB15794.1 hypothetical protein [Caulobacter sp. SLTY]